MLNFKLCCSFNDLLEKVEKLFPFQISFDLVRKISLCVKM